ncbi:MAG: hypothetical protein K6G42_10535 [Lachnospiraceae bacterium]|nr:hypothetical protein [Lachnospiraceae bacterium]
MKKKIPIELLLISLFAIFQLNMMACSVYTDSRAGWIGNWYNVKIITMSLGFLSFSLSRRLTESIPVRRIMLFLGNMVYSGGLLILMLCDHTGIDPIVALAVMYALGYVGGAVYYYMSVGVFSHSRGGLILAAGAALAYIIHYILWVRVKQDAIMLTVMIASFCLITFVVINPAKDWMFMDPLPYSADDKTLREGNKREIILAIYTTLIIMICTSRVGTLLLQSYAANSGAMYGISRLFVALPYFLMGFLIDRKKNELRFACVILAVIMITWIPSGMAESPAFLYIYWFFTGVLYSYIIFTFLRIAPKTGHCELWASFFRIAMIFDGLIGLILSKVDLNDMTSSFILSSLISIGIMGLVLMYFFFLRQKSPEAVPSGEHTDTAMQDKIDDMAGKYNLTPRERDVLALLMVKPDAQVSRLAEELGISRTMMYRYLNKLYEKTKTGNKDELTGLF